MSGSISAPSQRSVAVEQQQKFVRILLDAIEKELKKFLSLKTHRKHQIMLPLLDAATFDGSDINLGLDAYIQCPTAQIWQDVK
jgi:hypothetical protein